MSQRHSVLWTQKNKGIVWKVCDFHSEMLGDNDVTDKIEHFSGTWTPGCESDDGLPGYAKVITRDRPGRKKLLKEDLSMVEMD